MCEDCLAEVGGMEGLHRNIQRAHESMKEHERNARQALLCGYHKCPECVRAEHRIQVAPNVKLSPRRVAAIEQEWLDRGLIA